MIESIGALASAFVIFIESPPSLSRTASGDRDRGIAHARSTNHAGVTKPAAIPEKTQVAANKMYCSDTRYGRKRPEMAKAEKSKPTSSDAIFKAIGHEIRMDILRICSERVTSPNEFAKETDRAVNQVSYHFKALKRKGILDLVRTEPRRGAVEHFYVANVPAMIDDKVWAKMPEKSRLVVYRTILQALYAESAAAEAQGSFDADDAHLSWVAFSVDRQGRAEMVALLAEFLEQIEGIKAGSAERLREARQVGEEVVAAMMGFERAPRPGKSQI
jgi:DNA-binding transcriptional ArsR family regulator